MLEPLDQWILGLDLSGILGLWGALGLMVFATFSTWHSAMKRARLIEDVPRSTCRGAAMGYVELEGTQLALPGLEVTAPLTGTACIWWSYEIKKHVTDRDGDSKWVTIEFGTSRSPFLVDDGTGQALILPERAEVIAAHQLVWDGKTPRPVGPVDLQASGPYRYTERYLSAGEPLYALGHLAPLDDVDAVIDHGAEVTSLLERAAQNPSMLAVIDTNRDGRLDADEIRVAGEKASQLVRRWMDGVAVALPRNVLRAGDDETRPFILSADSQGRMVSSNRDRAAVSFYFLIPSAAALAYTVAVRLLS